MGIALACLVASAAHAVSLAGISEGR
jgi:hypothetical protein